jgi:transcriptional regulator with XRE-family HTH domain
MVFLVKMENDTLLTVNQRIKKLRKELKLTQHKFAEIITVSDGFVASIETNIREANERIQKLICDSFQVNHQWLKTGEGEIFSHDKESKFSKLMALFDNLHPKYQDYIIDAIDKFIKIQD